MRDVLSEDLKNLEKRYNKQLNYIGLDNEMLSLNLKNKEHDFKKLNEQYRNLQVIKQNTISFLLFALHFF